MTYLFFQISEARDTLPVRQAWSRIFLFLRLGKVEFCNICISKIIMSGNLDTDPDPVFDRSVFIDNVQLVDPVLFSDKLGDTNKGVPGRLLGKSQFYTEINANQYIIETIQEGYKLVFVGGTPPKTNF